MPESQHSGTSSGNIFTWGPTTQGLCHVVRLLEIIQKNVIFECMENVHKRTSAAFEGFCGFSKELAWSSHRAAVGCTSTSGKGIGNLQAPARGTGLRVSAAAPRASLPLPSRPQLEAQCGL